MSVMVVGGGGGAATWSGRPSVLADALMSVMVVVVWLVVGAATWSGRPSVRLVPSCRWWWSVSVAVQPRGAVARPSGWCSRGWWWWSGWWSVPGHIRTPPPSAGRAERTSARRRCFGANRAFFSELKTDLYAVSLRCRRVATWANKDKKIIQL